MSPHGRDDNSGQIYQSSLANTEQCSLYMFLKTAWRDPTGEINGVKFILALGSVLAKLMGLHLLVYLIMFSSFPPLCFVNNEYPFLAKQKIPANA